MAAPIYPLIKEALLEEIQGKPVNAPIPSERELAARYNASRMTIRNAVNELVAEGYLYRVKNKGTFVADQRLIKKNTSTAALKKEEDADYLIIYFSIKNAEADIAASLELEPDCQIIRIVRVNNKDKKPQSVEEIYYTRSMIPDEDVNNLDKLLDLNQYIEEGSVTQCFIPMNVPVKYVNILQLKLNTPIIMVESTILSKSGVPLIYVREFINPNEKKIEITT